MESLTEKINAIRKRGETAYLYCDTEEIAARMIPGINNLFVKHAKQQEYQIKHTTDLAMLIRSGSELVTKKFYEEF